MSRVSTATLDRAKVIAACTWTIADIIKGREEHREQMIERKMTARIPFFRAKSRESAVRWFEGCMEWEAVDILWAQQEWRARRLLNLATATEDERITVSTDDFDAIRSGWQRENTQ